MGNTDQLDEVLREVEELGLFREPYPVPKGRNDDTVALEGKVQVEDRWVTLRLVLDTSFPLTLPQFFLQPWDALGFIPHVTERGFVCFADPEGLVLDRRHPVRVVDHAFHRALGVLSDGVIGRNQGDFADEFEWYWASLREGVGAYSVLDPINEAGRVVVASNKDEFLWIARSQGDISAFRNGATVGGTLTLQNALYLPLEPGTIVIPPRSDRPFWTVEEARQVLLSGLSEVNASRLRQILKKRPNRREFVVAKLPRSSGGETLFGLRYDGVGELHPLHNDGTAERLVPIRIERRDRGYLVQRGGGEAGLGTKRVLLVGCGAVGGHLAFEIARAGVLNLTLVDSDTLTADNGFRHALGRQYWGQKKVRALKAAIEAQLPYARVTDIADTIEEVLAHQALKLVDYDMVVMAIGNPTVELEINQHLQALHDGPIALFTWLEPLGIGGHALLTGNDPDGGCFECLYTSPIEGEDTLQNRAAFAAPGQAFGRALSGCGSLHTPYGSVDAVRTTALATRLAVDTLTGKETGNPLLSWKGNSSAFEVAGFRLAPRYGATEDELHRGRYTYCSPRCPVCSRGDEKVL